MSTDLYVRNFVTSLDRLSGTTPRHLWKQRTPLFATFPCLDQKFGMYCLLIKKKRDSKRTRALFFDYARQSEEYALFAFNTGKLVISRDVLFD